LPEGPHRVLLELADPTHKVIDSVNVEFRIPKGTLEASSLLDVRPSR
jgi:hypothetical protein